MDKEEYVIESLKSIQMLLHEESMKSTDFALITNDVSDDKLILMKNHIEFLIELHTKMDDLVHAVGSLMGIEIPEEVES